MHVSDLVFSIGLLETFKLSCENVTKGSNCFDAKFKLKSPLKIINIL